jgi:hypothetical protein
MTSKERDKLSEEHATISENVGMILALVEESLREIHDAAFNTEQILRRLLSGI